MATKDRNEVELGVILESFMLGLLGIDFAKSRLKLDIRFEELDDRLVLILGESLFERVNK